ncbi:CdaR family transcriptional regulator [Kribbella rubisoli]|uniref:CdaR family transcriptional regulator n=1 Tax=Kribbella rubisoli TaxID=3075929 RepID=A0A4Q7X0F1_9ACTN|nr:helix-turn-helix domain-containing protein [Kribbella rubisoli]RZU16334.1 CdaR family transcriptional regulator [Kribbella rubisoli]
MSESGGLQWPGSTTANSADEAWLTAIAQAAAGDSEAPLELLVEYLTLLADAAISGRRPREHELAIVRELGRRAAEQGIPAGRVADLYLSAAWRMWRDLPDVVPYRDRDTVRASAQAVLRAVGEAIAVLVDSYQVATQQLVRQEESLRRELVDDLLRGDPDVARIVERAEPFGIDLGRPHQVVLARPADRLTEGDTSASMLELFILDRFGDREVLVATKEGMLVVLIPATAPSTAPRTIVQEVGTLIHDALIRHRSGREWRVATGRPYPGSYGIARSYEEAREALALADRLRLDAPVVNARDMLVYRVLVRDQAAIVDLIQAVLTPLTQARGGPEPLLQTLEAYFATGEVATDAARRLNVSVRTVTYRLAKVKELTGHDPGNPDQRFILHIAVLGAQLLDWPAHDFHHGADTQS